MYSFFDIRKGIAAILMIGMLAACNDNEYVSDKVSDGLISGQLLESRATEEGGENSYFAGKVTAVAFDADGAMVMVRENIQVEQNGKFSLVIGTKAKKCYFIANAPKDVVPGYGVTESAFKDMVMSGRLDNTLDPVMLGSIDVDSYHWEPIVMERCVARVDLKMQVTGISINRISIVGAADRSFLFPHENENPDGLEMTDFTVDFTDGALTDSKNRIMYLHEQNSGSPEVVMDVTVDGNMMELREKLPEKIKRNSLYTLKVYGNGAKLNMQVVENDWQNGQENESSVVTLARVNVESSNLDGARVNEKGDTVFIPYNDKNISLAVNTEEGMTIRTEGSLDLAEVSVVQDVARSASSLNKLTMVNVASRLKRIGIPKQYYYLESLDSNGMMKGRIVLVFESNPVQMTGMLSFLEDASYDFDRYIDGEYARLVLPEGMKAELEFGAGEDEWAILKKADDGSEDLRLLGGWKPNDEKADGRKQTVTLKLSNNDGSDMETYTISRLNYGLPVANVAGSWWCKYNLRGTANDFHDQILSSEDPAKEGSLLDYLTSCSPEELMAVMGDQYQGGNLEGLPLTVSDGKFAYSGFKSSVSVNINAQGKQMAPPGYEMPSDDDFRRLVASYDHKLGYTSVSYNNGMSGDNSYNIKYVHGNRAVTVYETSYGKIGFYDFCEEAFVDDDSRHMVIFGWGHQWEAGFGKISSDDIIFATNTGNSNSWVMEGWFDSMIGNWFKRSGQNNVKTRTIRCKKSPVEYIY